jgi:SAM-dependent methyltransferase
MREAALYTEGDYLQHNPDWHVSDSPWKARQVRSMLIRNNLRPRSVCEVGCGAGGILHELHDSLDDGVHYVGYEISPQAYDMCRTRERARLNFRFGDITQENVRFDLVLVMDVIEHLEDYYSFLRAVRSRGTYTILHVPLEISVQAVLRRTRLLRQRSAVGHLHYFTRETALATLRELGFEVLDHFLTAGGIERPTASGKARLARLPRRLLAASSEDWAARLLGGFSLLALTRPALEADR